MSSFLIKTCLKFHKCSRLTTIWYTWNYPSWGGADQVHTPKNWNSKIWPLSLSDKCNLILWWKLSFLWKSEPDPTHLRGVFELIFLLMVPSLHALPIHVFWAWYVFLNEYTTYFSFSGAHSRQKYGLQPYFCLIGQIWANLKAPPDGELQACWGPYTSPVITAILDVILKPMQSDSVGYWLFSCQISEL